MPEIQPAAVDSETFALNLTVSLAFLQAMKKPELDDEGEGSVSSAAAESTVKHAIAGLVAQGVTGFGL